MVEEIKLKNFKEDMLKKLEKTHGGYVRNSKGYILIVQVGNKEESNTYIRNKTRALEKMNINYRIVNLDENISRNDLFNNIVKMLHDYLVKGIIVQKPLPKSLTNKEYKEEEFLNNMDYAIDKFLINKLRDIDGTSAGNRAYDLKYSAFIPCTPLGILIFLRDRFETLEGLNVCMIGRSDLVGSPMANLLIKEGCTVTVCNSKTKDLRSHTKNKDIVISAIGKDRFLDKSYFNDKQLIIDVGINFDEDGKMHGDVDIESLREDDESTYFVTTVPGGVGQLTQMAICMNSIKALTGKCVLDNIY